MEREAEFHIRQTPHSYGHESAAQRYSATRIQAGFGPERPTGNSLTWQCWNDLKSLHVLCKEILTRFSIFGI
uniref:Uncharacterized protein n=1 Tax=Oryzias latipes TaxID=8090 RepID=A0A3P9KWG0_ORYLA